MLGLAPPNPIIATYSFLDLSLGHRWIWALTIRRLHVLNVDWVPVRAAYKLEIRKTTGFWFSMTSHRISLLLITLPLVMISLLHCSNSNLCKVAALKNIASMQRIAYSVVCTHEHVSVAPLMIALAYKFITKHLCFQIPSQAVNMCNTSCNIV